MPIYKYTLIKYLKAISTWVIVGVSMLLVIVLGGYVPFRVAKVDTPTNYAVVSVAIVAAITSFLSIFTSVFAGFKSAAMFKDEVEDGTFLVMLSKPITRSKIIFHKWLALQTAIIGYTFIVALSFLFAVSVFDTGHKIAGELSAMGLKTLRSQIIVISLLLWFILFVVSLIFSSIALLLSTKLTVGTTIGISIAIGVIIPVTALIGTFTSKPAYKMIGNSNNARLLEATFSSQLAQQEGVIKNLSADQKIKELIGKIQSDFTNKYSLTDNKETLYGLGLATNDHDTFKYSQIFDFNYQIQKLSEFASEQAIPEIAREGLDFSKNGQALKTVTNVAQKDNPFNGEFLAQMDVLNKMIVSSWKITEPYRLALTELFVETLKIASINTPITVRKDFFDGKFTNVKIIDNTTKQQFISDITAPNGFMSWIAKAEVPESEAEIYKNATSGIAQIMNDVFKDKNSLSFEKSGLSNEEQENLRKYFYSFGGIMESLYFPIGFWANSQSINSFMKQNDVAQKTYIFSPMESALHQDNPATNSLGYLKETLRAWDIAAYNEIASSIEQGYSIAKIKTIEYTNKFTILWIYLAIALVLVPASYFVIRKQDFR